MKKQELERMNRIKNELINHKKRKVRKKNIKIGYRLSNTMDDIIYFNNLYSKEVKCEINDISDYYDAINQLKYI